jgi:hypothetical protein
VPRVRAEGLVGIHFILMPFHNLIVIDIEPRPSSLWPHARRARGDSLSEKIHEPSLRYGAPTLAGRMSKYRSSRALTLKMAWRITEIGAIWVTPGWASGSGGDQSDQHGLIGLLSNPADFDTSQPGKAPAMGSSNQIRT